MCLWLHVGGQDTQDYRFPNDYGASVVSGPRSLKGSKAGYRMYVLHYDSPAPDHSYCIERETSLTDDYIEVKEWREIEDRLKQVYELPPGEVH